MVRLNGQEPVVKQCCVTNLLIKLDLCSTVLHKDGEIVPNGRLQIPVYNICNNKIMSNTNHFKNIGSFLMEKTIVYIPSHDQKCTW